MRPRTRVLKSSRSARDARQTLIALGLYLVLALAVTWPWVTHPGGILYGIQGGDQTASVSQFQQDADNLQPPFLRDRIPDVHAPEGQETMSALSVAGIGHSAVLFALSVLFGSIAAHGLTTVLGLSLSAFAMFLPLGRIAENFGASLVIGLAFGFWRYTYVTGWTWPPYIHGWVFPLLFWRMLEVSERSTLRNGVLAGAAAVVAMTWVQYNLLIPGVLFAASVAVALVRACERDAAPTDPGAACERRGRRGGRDRGGGGSSGSGLPTRAPDDAISGSAGRSCTCSPGPTTTLFGDLSGVPAQVRRPHLRSERHRAVRPDPRWHPLLLLVTFGKPCGRSGDVERRRRGCGRPGMRSSRACRLDVLRTARRAGVRHKRAVAYTLLNEVTTVFRVAHRFAVVAMMAICVLAAIELAAILPRDGAHPSSRC